MPSVVLILKATRASPAAAQHVPAPVAAEIQKKNLRLTPQFPGATDPELSRYFVVTVPSNGDAEEVARSLRAIPGVDAAYVQPEPSPPAP
jgi:hypothetical protein